MIFSKKTYKLGAIGTKLLKQWVSGTRTPIYVGLFVTQRCNLKCAYCFPDSPHRKEKDPTLKEIFDIVDELYRIGTRYITILGGEPTIRNDFDQIVDYITGKGILTEVGTNGYFTERWISSYKKLHLVCHSIDGNEQDHDKNRGKGSFKKVYKSLELCHENNIPVQIRSVFTKYNTNSLEYLLDLGKKMGTSLALAEQAVVKQSDMDTILESQALREFWKQVRHYKREGHNIAKSYTLLDKIIDFPVEFSPDKIFMGDVPLPESLKGYTECHLSNGYCFIDTDGMMYPCAPLFGKFGINIHEGGIQTAWEKLGKERPCRLCRQSVMDLKSYFFARDMSSIFEGVRNVITK